MTGQQFTAAELAEIWRAVPGYEGLYEISDRSRVRSLDREIRYSDGRVRLHRGQVIAPGRDRQFLNINLWRGNKVRIVKLHRLFAAAFIGAPPSGYWAVRGREGEIEWRSPAEVANALLDAGRNGRQKITRRDAREIRRRFESGERQCNLAREFGLGKAQLSAICLGRAWTR